MRFRSATITMIGVLGAAVALSCAGPVEAPTWDITKSGFDPYGSGAILSPANDTRANLMLLLADRHGLPMTAAGAKPGKVPLVMMPWRIMAEQAVPPGESTSGPVETDSPQWGTRCHTRDSGGTAYKAGLADSRASAAEKAVLAAARDALRPDCEAGTLTVTEVATTTRAGGAYGAYLAAAGDFYGGKFDQAATVFEALASNDDRWLRETARYMIARNALNKAIAGSIGDYGELVEPAKRDGVDARQAAAGFAAYLKAFPRGAYANSARGLVRRAHWLAGDGNSLAADYATMLSSVRNSPDATDLIEEIDSKVATDNPGAKATNPLLLTVQDLQRMRGVSVSDWGERHEQPAQIGKAELDSQSAIFRAEPALYGYLQAAHAFWVRKDPRAALALIPDATHQPRFTYLEFSRQMLRGMALDAVKDRNARGFWLSLFSGATRPYQNGAVQLALAGHDQASGNVAAIFATGSPVTHIVMRDLLLEFTAGPALLRQQVERGQSDHERKVALYILLAKELQRGLYRDFVADSAVIPAATADGEYAWAAQYYTTTYNDELGNPPLDAFRAKPDAATGCRPIRETAGMLADDPAAPRSMLCLAEFFRAQGFDQFEFDQAPEWSGLGRGPSQFPGKPYVRMATYRAVLANGRASADDKAFALNRMVRCYAPAGNSDCGGEQEDKAVRKGWYNRLKRDYSASAWARDLHYYW